MNYFLRTQTEIYEELELRMRNTENSRWSREEMYSAINAVVRRWNQRVRIPFLYTISGGWAGTSFTLALPDYIDPRFMRPRISTTANDEGVSLDTDYDTFIRMPGYEVEPDGDNGNTLRLNTIPYAAEGNILFWSPPGPVPTELGAVAADSTTSMTVTISEMNLPKCGYIKVNNEWIQYAGLTHSGSVATLSNLVRSVLGTTTATHNATDVVNWGLPVDRIDLYEHLFAQCAATLHQMFLTNAAPAEREHHQWNMRYAQQQADEFWSGYYSAYEPQLHIETRNQLTGLEH